MGKYEPLEAYLKDQEMDEITLSFSEVNDIITGDLPPSAYKHIAWWSNTWSHTQSVAWMNSGFKSYVDIETESVTFHKEEENKQMEPFPYEQRVKEYESRWNVPERNKKKSLEKFKNRFQNIIEKRRDLNYETTVEFYNMVGENISFKEDDSYKILLRTHYEHYVTKVLKKVNDFNEYMITIQKLFWSLEKNRQFKTIDDLFSDFRDILIMSPGIEISINKSNHEVIIFPSGANLLDEEIINHDLLWLEPFPQVQRLFQKSLSDFLSYENDPVVVRTILDNLRASLEKLIQLILDNNRTLENNQKAIKDWLSSKGVNSNIIGSLRNITHYIELMNDVKHTKEIEYLKFEIEHMIYQTGVFIRLILEVERK